MRGAFVEILLIKKYRVRLLPIISIGLVFAKHRFLERIWFGFWKTDRFVTAIVLILLHLLFFRKEFKKVD